MNMLSHNKGSRPVTLLSRPIGFVLVVLIITTGFSLGFGHAGFKWFSGSKASAQGITKWTDKSETRSTAALVNYSGTYNVGATEGVASLTNTGGGMFELINSGVVTGDVTLNITSDLTNETGAIVLAEFASPFSITIKPNGAARTISGTSAIDSALIRLEDADRVIIDGSLSGGTDRSLTIANNSTDEGVVIWIASVSNGANNNTVKNCNISGSTGLSMIAGVYAGTGGAIGPFPAPFPNSNNTIQNNVITRVVSGAFLVGNTSSLDQNWVVSGNTFGSTVSGDKLGLRGVLIGNSQNMSISGNTVIGVSSSVSSTRTMTGIEISFNINGGSISRNKIRDIRQNNPAGWGSNGIFLNADTTDSNLTISNNFVSDIVSQGFAGTGSTDNGYGIMIDLGGGYNIYHNTVYMNSNQVSPGSVTAALNINQLAATPVSIDVRNNIFVNAQTVGTRYAVLNQSIAGPIVFSLIDYNDYFAQNVGFMSGAQPSLANWQSATLQDTHSSDVDPLLTSAIDLHLLGSSPLLGDGTPAVSVTVDIDNDPRPATFPPNGPDIGADELVQSAGGLIPSGNYYNALAAPFDMLGGNVTITGALHLSFIPLDTNGNTLTLDCSASVNGAGPFTAWVIGPVKKNYCAPGVFSFPTGTANGYMPVNTNVTALGTNPSSLTVVAHDDGLAPSSPSLNPATTLSAYWSLTKTGTLTSNLTFTYLDGDIAGTEASYKVISVESLTPFHHPTTVLNAGANTATVSGIQSFSDWTVGEPSAPTSTTANVSGRVVDNLGAPLSGVTMTLLDTVLVENRTTVTDANGVYFFDAILTGRQILVTPSRNGYTFNPQNSVFNHTGELTNVDFTGTPDSSQTSIGNDFDGDGKTDLSIFRPSDATWYTLLSSTGVLKAEQWGAGTDRIAPADYDGDHQTDVAVFRPSTGTWYIHQSSNSTLRSVNWGIAEDVIAPADFDGDGQADLAVWRPSTGTWYIIESHNGQTRTVQWGTSGDRPVAADYDGDGKADLAVWRPSNGLWYILNSSDGSYKFEHWGIEEDRPVTGDYDGDTKSDLAIFRPSTATWYVKLSSNGSTSTQAHGTAADMLTPADYDGDGKTDRAVWQLNGDWNILRSTTNTAGGQKWGTTGDIPTPSAYVP